MLLLPAQTSRYCWHRLCQRRAVARNRFDMFLGTEHWHASDPRDVCSLHRRPSSVEEFGEARIIVSVTPLPPFCPTCGCDEDVDGCTKLQWARNRALNDEPCTCTTCVVYGGDCAYVASSEAAWDVLIEHGVRPETIIEARKVRDESTVADSWETAHQQIEFPMRGETYAREQYGVYEYDTHPASTLLAGQQRRTFLDSFETLDEAKNAYPEATFVEGSGYRAPVLHHLPDDEA